MIHNKIIYSLVIVHRDMPVLLHRLLGSVRKRPDLQLIVVDDCSTPENIGKVGRMLREEFPYAEFLSTDRACGAGGARNAGLRQAVGRYVLFADSDDYFSPCLDEVLTDFALTDFDIVYFNVLSVDSSTYAPCRRAVDRNTAFSSVAPEESGPFPADGGEMAETMKYRFTTAWGKLFRRRLIEEGKLRFEESQIANDVRFSTEADSLAVNVRADRRCLYCLTATDKSVSHTSDPVRRLERFAIDCRRNAFLREKGVISDSAMKEAVGQGLHYVVHSLNEDRTSDDICADAPFITKKTGREEAFSLCRSLGIGRREARSLLWKYTVIYRLSEFGRHLIPAKFRRIAVNLLTD